MDYTCAQGIPFSIFAGRVPADGEPLWLAEDRATATVWQQFERSKCPRCGTWDWEWEENPLAWTADYWTCSGCKQIDQANERLTGSHQKTHGMQVRMFKGG